MQEQNSTETIQLSKQTEKPVKALTARHLAYCGMFSTMIAVGAFLKIPIPVVPFTLQFLFTMMAGLLLGGKLGALSVGVYIILGLAGLPIFSEGGGLWYLLKPSFGYLIGFCIGSYVTGKMVERAKKCTVRHLLTANFTGLLIVYAVGMAYYYVVCNAVLHTPIGVWPLFLYCFLLAVPGDICLCILSAFLGKKLIPIIRKGR